MSRVSDAPLIRSLLFNQFNISACPAKPSVPRVVVLEGRSSQSLKNFPVLTSVLSKYEKVRLRCVLQA